MSYCIYEDVVFFFALCCHTEMAGSERAERTLDTYSNKELFDVVQKQCNAYYYIGEYYYIVYKM